MALTSFAYDSLAEIAAQEAATEQAAIAEALGKEEAAKVAAAEVAVATKPPGLFDKLMTLVRTVFTRFSVSQGSCFHVSDSLILTGEGRRHSTVTT
jgi:hypothetical protein